ncbi:MAG: SDR family oxidoreductase [Alphaproteobacteria bacterium]|nr:SDR family oxidoreductase [Alphaproteobacteria bacterium]
MAEDAPLAGKVAIVTGSARNIGRAIVLALADAGAAVVVNARADRAGVEETVGLVTRKQGRAIAHMADVTSEAAVKGMVDAALAAFGGLDILVNNAAVRRQQAFESMTLAQWREIMAIALDGAFLCARAAVPHMLKAGAGTIVNIGGRTGHMGAAERAHVIAAKAGIVGLTKALAIEYAQKGITANCVVPGVIDTARGASAGGSGHHPGGETPPMGRKGRPEEIAAMVRHLCLPQSRFITGQTMHVNGGHYLP